MVPSSRRTPGATSRSRPVRSPCAVGLLALLVSSPARADHHEAQWSARPFAGVAELKEDGATDRRAIVGGLSLGLSYGVSNRLDIGVELVGIAATMPTFRDATVIIDGGAVYRGPLVRRTDDALLFLGPTWRFGVAWIPVVSIGVGSGVRSRSAGTFTEIAISPEEKQPAMDFELAAMARVGIEHRVNRRLVVGAYAAALASWGPTTPMLPIASVSVGVSYVHYPLW